MFQFAKQKVVNSAKKIATPEFIQSGDAHLSFYRCVFLEEQESVIFNFCLFFQGVHQAGTYS